MRTEVFPTKRNYFGGRAGRARLTSYQAVDADLRRAGPRQARVLKHQQQPFLRLVTIDLPLPMPESTAHPDPRPRPNRKQVAAGPAQFCLWRVPFLWSAKACHWTRGHLERTNGHDKCRRRRVGRQVAVV